MNAGQIWTSQEQDIILIFWRLSSDTRMQRPLEYRPRLQNRHDSTSCSFHCVSYHANRLTCIPPRLRSCAPTQDSAANSAFAALAWRPEPQGRLLHLHEPQVRRMHAVESCKRLARPRRPRCATVGAGACLRAAESASRVHRGGVQQPPDRNTASLFILQYSKSMHVVLVAVAAVP